MIFCFQFLDVQYCVSMAVRLDPELWEEIKNKFIATTAYGGKGWNARKAQMAVKEYKARGGRYSPAVPRSKTSLKKWTDEKWGYAGKEGKSRYLPEKVRKSMSAKEKRIENRRKSNKKGTRVPYTESTKKKMRAAGVF